MTRFAPLLGLYTLCLILGMVMMYIDDTKNFWFASHMGRCIQFMSVVNLIYAPIVAMLLFGDLYNSRMCNALHAMPLRREEIFWTNVASGLVFSLVPTAVMALASLPLLAGTCVIDAWQIGLWWFLGTNLEFVCFFGIAVFSVFCVGNRFTMALVYAALNAGAYLIYWIIDTVYTPMLYGVVTPSALAGLLTPIANMMDKTFLEVEEYAPLLNLFETTGTPIEAEFWLHDTWGYLWGYAGAGVVLLLLALVLYRRRSLECAGDAMASKKLEPVFQVCFCICAAAFCYMFCQLFFGSNSQFMYLFLGFGLVVGWFAAKMLIERTIRVFRLKTWLGLLGMAAAVAASIGLTLLDPLNIEGWIPDPEKVQSATIYVDSSYGTVEVTGAENIADLCRLQEMALEDQLETSGPYPIIDGAVQEPAVLYTYEYEVRRELECRYATTYRVYYKMDSGRTITRNYYIWADGPRREIVQQYFSDWDVISQRWLDSDWTAPDLTRIRHITIAGEYTSQKYWTEDFVRELLAAAQADAEAGTLVQSGAFHDGHFFATRTDPYNGETYDEMTRGIDISIRSMEDNSRTIYFSAYLDSENLMAFLQKYDLLDQWEISEKSVYGG